MMHYFRKRTRRVSFRQIWDRLRVSFWFAPLVMAFVAVLLARIFYYIDTRIPNEVLENSRLILSGNSSELRGNLIAMATTTLATAGIVFSLLTLPLSTVAAQYGSRLLRIYLGDRTTQFVLGMFSGTFCYCLYTAISLPPPDVLGEIPQITVTFALTFFLATFASLIALIHHISTSLQAPNIVASAGAELRATIHSLAEETGDVEEKKHPTIPFSPDELVDERGYAICAKDSGYLQSIDLERMLHLAIEADVIIRLVRKPGQFISAGSRTALVWPREYVDVHLAIRIRHAFQIGRQRTPTQDVEYAVNQLVEVAMRAMSPAINDPYTAMTCLDYLGTSLANFAGQDRPSPNLYDANSVLRLIYEPVSFTELASAAFNMLRHASRDNAAVLLRMLDAMEEISRKTQQGEQRQVLLNHVQMVRAESQIGNLIDADKLTIQQHCDELANIMR